ncbi:MAG: HAMP domain-containing histidine kinase [Verrucomicrobiales bacterium]|nr:HAMP domain-containing histidine kinase [Verrucomicrobiales bacterium]
MARRLLPRSFKYRLLLAFFLGLFAVGAASGYLSYRLIARYTWTGFDSLLVDKLEFYKSTLFFNEKGRPGWHMGEADWDRVMDAKDPDYFVFRYPDGRFIGKSPTLGDAGLPRLGIHGEAPEFYDIKLPNGRPGRAVGALRSVQFYPHSPQRTDARPVPVHLVVARSTSSAEQTLHRLVVLLWQAGAVAMTALLGTAFLIIRRSVRPVGQLELQIESMPLADPRQRFRLKGASAEMEKVVGRLNALMDRVGAAIEHERQFTSNAAHELRTPLAGMRSAIELALNRPRKPEEYEETLLQLQEIQAKLQRLTDNLLLLARLESGQREFPREEADLGKFVRKAWKPFFDPAAEKELRLLWQIAPQPAPVVLPVTLLEIVLRNLYQNAVDYTPRGGEIEISGRVTDGQCELRVSNANPGVRLEQLPNLFQPFWRADQSGDPNQVRTGIGLALCRRILTTLDGQIAAEMDAAGRFSIALHFPLADSGKKPGEILPAGTAACDAGKGTPEP